MPRRDLVQAQDQLEHRVEIRLYLPEVRIDAALKQHRKGAFRRTFQQYRQHRFLAWLRSNQPHADQASERTAGRSKGDSVDFVLVPINGAEALARVGIPQPDRPVDRWRCQHPPVWRPRDPTNPALVSSQRAQELDASRKFPRSRRARVTLTLSFGHRIVSSYCTCLQTFSPYALATLPGR